MLTNNINWMTDGEKGDAVVLNRALKELVGLIDSKDFDPVVNKNGLKVDPATIHTSVVDGDFVYKDIDGIYYRALGSDTIREKTIGVYKIIDTVPVILFNGAVTLTGLTKGMTYYLDTINAGKITSTDYFHSTQVGIALSSTLLLVSIIPVVKRTQRHDKEFAQLDVTNINYDINSNVTDISYSTGNKEIWDRTGDILNGIRYFATDGITLIAQNIFTYDVNNNLISTTWTEI